MALFDRFQLSQEEAEELLTRRLNGDPTRGELGLLVALNAYRLDDVRIRLAHEGAVGADLKALVSSHLDKARARWETRKAWSVAVPVPVWEEYARDSRSTGRSISECLASAIRRDYERRKGALEPIQALNESVTGFHSAAAEVIQGAREVLERLGSLQDLALRLGRIEAALSAFARR